MEKSKVKLGGVFDVVCRDKDGRVKWVEKAHNLVTNEGLDHILDVSAAQAGSADDEGTVVAIDGASVRGGER